MKMFAIGVVAGAISVIVVLVGAQVVFGLSG